MEHSASNGQVVSTFFKALGAGVDFYIEPSVIEATTPGSNFVQAALSKPKETPVKW